MSKTTIWTGALGGDWQQAGNWTNGIPAHGDDVILRVGPDVPALNLIYYGSQQLALNSFTIEDPANNEAAQIWRHYIGGGENFSVATPMNLGSYCGIIGGVYNQPVCAFAIGAGLFTGAVTILARPDIIQPEPIGGTFRGPVTVERDTAFYVSLFDSTSHCNFSKPCVFSGCTFVGSGEFVFHADAALVTAPDGVPIMADNPVLKVAGSNHLVVVGYVDGDYTIEQLGTGGNPIPIKPRSPISSLVPGAIPEDTR